MVIEIDTVKDSPEEIRHKIEAAEHALAEKQRETQSKSLAHLCGSVKWGEDALDFQRRLRDEWTHDGRE